MDGVVGGIDGVSNAWEATKETVSDAYEGAKDWASDTWNSLWD